MTKARNLQRSDKLTLNLNAEVLSVELLANGLIKVRIAATGSPSLISPMAAAPSKSSARIQFVPLAKGWSVATATQR